MSAFDPAVQRFLALLTHELRNPVGAITGYQELLADGLYGEVDDGGREALGRIRNAGDQLLSLLDGVNELIKPGSSLTVEMLFVPLEEIVARAIEGAQQLAAGRGANLQTPPLDSLGRVRTDPVRLERMLDLALGAAVRSSPSGQLSISFELDPDGVQQMLVHGTSLDAERDDPALQVMPDQNGGRAIATGAGLRLAMAKRLANSMAVDVDLRRDGDSTTLKMGLGTGIDSREAAP
jgi:signal transduction histidine kinase